jgi:hypothetical protein
MRDQITKYDIPKKALSHGRRLTSGAIAAPVILTALPAILFLILLFLFGSAPPAAVTLLFFGVISTVIGALVGLTISGVLLYKRSNWTREMRELIAADGIKAGELDWFMHELKSQEKRALKQIERRDLLLGDAYRDTLASRLTATRISKSSRRELALMERRRSKLKNLRADRTPEFISEVERDIGKLKEINMESQQMLIEAEARLQMLEAASIRGGGLADNELALKRLNSRAAELPLALEEAKLTDEIRRELENEFHDGSFKIDDEEDE